MPPSMNIILEFFTGKFFLFLLSDQYKLEQAYS